MKQQYDNIYKIIILIFFFSNQQDYKINNKTLFSKQI